MHYGEIKKCDIANGPGVRVSLFVSGCRNHCPGCFNKETWDFCYGKSFTAETKDHIMELLKPDYIEGFSLGVYLHGLAGDHAKHDLGAYSMIASDIIAHIKDVTGGNYEPVL